MKEYIIRVVALNSRSEGLLNKAFSGVSGGLISTLKKIGLGEDDYTLQYEETQLRKD